MNKQELLKYVGSVEQIGGIRDVTYNDGRAKGVRAIEVSTGDLTFTVLPDRCMDIAQASFKGKAFSWISKTGVVAPQYYEKDGKSWLRGFYGGLITTCGLHNIGGPADGYGLHDRISYVPAEKVSIFADWEGEEYVMRISGEMRDASVFGPNLVLKRTITAKLFDNCFTVEDTMVNDGFATEKIAFNYHCNFGYPLVCEGARILNVPEEYAEITGPIHGKTEECIAVKYTDPQVTVGIANDTMEVSLTYLTDTLPDFVIWKMLGESEYVVGLEPRTTALGGENIRKQNTLIDLAPFEERRMKLTFAVSEK